MNRPWQIGALFGACALLLLAATGWITHTALRYERAEAAARHQAAFEESVRLALWRMDSALAPLIAEERARPYFAYASFYPAEAAYARMFAQGEANDVLIPSPLLDPKSPHVYLYFQLDPGGQITTPQVPPVDLLLSAGSAYWPERAEAAQQRLIELRTRLPFGGLWAALPAIEEQPAGPVVVRRLQARSKVQQQRRRARHDTEEQQSLLNQAEYEARSQAYQQMQPAAQAAASPPPSAAESVREGVFQPLWINGLLLLVRRVSISGEDYAQGCWLDWDELRPWLLDSVGDLLPNASLEPADAATLVDGGERRLAGLPIRLVASPGRDMVTPRSPQIWMPLAAAWACVILAAVAVGMVLFGTVALSERRAAFVSAVTHELRTPLTTFRLYTEMLAGGMVRNAEKRQGYLATLHTEALRLGHLVENVLAYARLERNRAPICRERIGLPDFLARVADRFKERAEQAGMELVVEAAAIDRSDGPESASHALRVDAQALEQILFNLIDNACKYAQTSTDRRIHLRVNQVAQAIEFQVRDHGPGLGPAEHRRLFRPFHKSAREAADTAPGVGLGLALSRRLARAIGGKLRLTPCDDGACFTLTLRT